MSKADSSNVIRLFYVRFLYNNLNLNKRYVQKKCAYIENGFYKLQ